MGTVRADFYETNALALNEPTGSKQLYLNLNFMQDITGVKKRKASCI